MKPWKAGVVAGKHGADPDFIPGCMFHFFSARIAVIRARMQGNLFSPALRLSMSG